MYEPGSLDGRLFGLSRKALVVAILWLHSLVVGASENTCSRVGGDMDPCAKYTPVLPNVAINQAVERVLCASPEIDEARAWLGIAHENLNAVRALYLPRLSLGGEAVTGTLSYNYRSEAVASLKGRDNQLAAAASLDWLLYDFGHKSALMANGEYQERAALADRDQAALMQGVQAAGFYYQVVASREALTSARQILTAAIRNSTMAVEQYRSGVASLSDKLQAEVVVANARYVMSNAEGEYRSNLGTLNVMMGIPACTTLVLTTPLEVIVAKDFFTDLGRLMDQAGDQYPALRAAKLRLRAAEYSVTGAKTSNNPTIALTARSDLQSVDEASEFSQPAAISSRSFGVSINIPLYDGGLQSAQVRAASADERAAKDQLLSVQRDADTQAWKSYQALMTGARNIIILQAMVQQAETSFDVVSGRYKSGVGSMIEVLNALNTLALTKNQSVQAQLAWRQARLKLVSFLGEVSAG